MAERITEEQGGAVYSALNKCRELEERILRLEMRVIKKLEARAAALELRVNALEK